MNLKSLKRLQLNKCWFPFLLAVKSAFHRILLITNTSYAAVDFKFCSVEKIFSIPSKTVY